jgi:hypothetical protein
MNKTLLFTFSIIFLFVNKISAWNSPEVVAPRNTVISSIGVTVNWNAVNNSQGYHLEIDTLATFSTPAKLRFSKNYISASSEKEDTEHSLNNLLKVFEGPTLLAPMFNENNVSLNADFDWQDIDEAKAYIISIDTSSDFSTQFLDTTEISEYTTALNKGSNRYYWRVMAQRDTQNSIWSDVYEFKTESAASTFSAFDKPMLSIFPNPTNGTLFVSSEQLIQNIMVFDNAGKLMVDYNNSNAQKQLHLDLHTWATGTYFLIVKMQDGTEAKHNFFVKGN